MAKLTKTTPAPAAPAATAPSGNATAAPAAPVAAAPAVPFSVQTPGAAAEPGPGNRPNLVQKRQEKIAQALADGSPFAFKEVRNGQEFQCICGATGKNAIVLTDKAGKEVLVGSNCLKHTGVEVPKQPRSARGPSAPGVNKQQKFADALGKFTAPFAFARKQTGPFTCFCGGRGENQIVVRDAQGAEFSVGNTCAALIPGVDVPKAQKQAKAAAPSVAGLKGNAAPPPSFDNVS